MASGAKSGMAKNELKSVEQKATTSATIVDTANRKQGIPQTKKPSADSDKKAKGNPQTIMKQYDDSLGLAREKTRLKMKDDIHSNGNNSAHILEETKLKMSDHIHLNGNDNDIH
ncbi:hypothetical protein JTB14_034584 [Gonioctena quinquepunctata]|nr:hypothetical protein JTB14_034584 [Gonioctena quinquepunctata]